MMWSERHRPRSVAGMVGNEEARAAASEWLAKWRRGARPLLLVGPPGTGKTTVAHLLASGGGYDLVGLNASDARGKSRISGVLGPVLGSAGMAGPPMIFVDEVDGIHGRGDLGGAAALAGLLKGAAVPMVLAANDDSHDRMRAIRKACQVVRFRRVPPRLLRVYLSGVLEREGASLGPGTLVSVVSRSRGDIRSLLNLAQAQVTGFDPQAEAPPQAVGVEEGVEAFFRAGSDAEARAILYSMQADPREKIGALYSSVVSSGLAPGRLAECMDALSRADVLHGRIRRTQNWRLLRYLNEALVPLRAAGRGARYSQYSLSWQELNRVRWDGAKIRALASAMSARLRVSPSFFAASCLPCMAQCARAGTLEPDPEFAEVIMKEAGA